MRSLLSAAVLGVFCAGVPAFGQSCLGLACQQQICSNGGTTTVSGTVFAPNGVDPLPNVLVYVPGDPLPLAPLTPGVGGPVATGGTLATNSPLVFTHTAIDGTFTLGNVPVGINIPLVIQAGKWRRLFNIPNVAACTNTALPVNGPNQIRFPRNQGEGDIPKIALVTGSVDELECVQRKIGIDDSEFTDPSGSGRVNLYSGAGSPGAIIDANTPIETTLENTIASLSQYDIVMFPCQGLEVLQTSTALNNLVQYANTGGRIMATHYSYVWLLSTFPGTVNWTINQPAPTPDPQTATINTSFPGGAQLASSLPFASVSAASASCFANDRLPA